MSDQIQNDHIYNFFSVNIVLTLSEKVKELKYNFIDLFKQFNLVNSLTTFFKDPITNHNIKISSLSIKIRELDEFQNVPSNSITLKKMLNEAVQKFDVLDPKYESCLETPWYDEWKKIFLSNFEVCDHEFIGANFGAIFLLTVDDLNDMKNLIFEMQKNVKQATNIKWFQPNFFKYFVVINIKHGFDHEKENNYAQQMKLYFDELALTYGTNSCFWLDVELQKDFITIQKEVAVDNYLQSINNNDFLNYSFNLNMYISNESSKNSDNVLIKYNESLLLKIDTLLKEMIINVLLPWSEKQIKILNDSISLRKGFRKSIFTATKQIFQISSTVNLRGTQNNITYNPEANEMQNRKLADMAMCLRLYDLAYSFYSAAKKDFQSDGAWLYFAGSCEALALSSYLMNKFQKHYFDQAISCYLETCKSMSLATRTVLISTDIIRKIWPIEASSYFIKLISDDSHLRSALFLEQAAKSFMQTNPPKKRKTVFYFILAGHRFKKCNLKKHALYCYQKYKNSNWKDAYEHANQIVARLCLQISDNTVDEENKKLMRLNGLKILKNNCYKELFLKDFLSEISNDDLNTLPQDLFELKIPGIKFISKEYSEESTYQVCYVNEPSTFYITLKNNFQIELKNFRLLIDNNHIKSCIQNVMLEPSLETTITCYLKPEKICDFQIYGIQFEIQNFTFYQKFNDSFKKLKFKSLETLPLINCSLCLGQSDKEIDSFEGFSCEIVDLYLDLRNNCDSVFNNSIDIKLETDAVIMNSDKEISQKNCINEQFRLFKLKINEVNKFMFKLPFACRNKSLKFKIQYSNNKLSRTIVKNLQIYVKQCLQMDFFINNVLSLKNMQAYLEISLNVTSKKDKVYNLKPENLVHLLIEEKSMIEWRIGNRFGCIELKEFGLLDY